MLLTPLPKRMVGSAATELVKRRDRSAFPLDTWERNGDYSAPFSLLSGNTFVTVDRHHRPLTRIWTPAFLQHAVCYSRFIFWQIVAKVSPPMTRQLSAELITIEGHHSLTIASIGTRELEKAANPHGSCEQRLAQNLLECLEVLRLVK